MKRQKNKVSVHLLILSDFPLSSKHTGSYKIQNILKNGQVLVVISAWVFVATVLSQNKSIANIVAHWYVFNSFWTTIELHGSEEEDKIRLWYSHNTC